MFPDDLHQRAGTILYRGSGQEVLGAGLLLQLCHCCPGDGEQCGGQLLPAGVCTRRPTSAAIPRTAFDAVLQLVL